MNEKQIQARVKDAAEQKAPAATIDLWPAIRTRLAEITPASGKATRQPRIISRPQLQLAALVAITLLLAGAVFLAHMNKMIRWTETNGWKYISPQAAHQAI